MGDGSVDRGKRKNPRLIANMTSQNYLEHIDEMFEMLGKGVSLTTTAEESVNNVRNSGFRPTAKVEDYHDLYRWRSMRHPELQEFAEWYSTGEKVWPEDIELTPTVLKHWYCGDGHWNNSGTSNHIEISMANEVENIDKVEKIFDNASLPSPSNYMTCKRNDGTKRCEARFSVEQSKELWEYMGEPLPDFEYKWPEQYRNTYPDRERNMGTQ